MWRSLVLLLTLTVAVNAQQSQLGRVEFPTSGSQKAKAHFLRGLAALHSFWFEEALEALCEMGLIEQELVQSEHSVRSTRYYRLTRGGIEWS